MSTSSYQVRVADESFWREQIKCQFACPVHTDARGYVRAIAEGNYELAYLTARGPNPLASMCGRICGAPCETACRRGTIDQPIAIRALKRFVCERFGAERHADQENALSSYIRENAVVRACDDEDESVTCSNSFPRRNFRNLKANASQSSGPAPRD